MVRISVYIYSYYGHQCWISSTPERVSQSQTQKGIQQCTHIRMLFDSGKKKKIIKNNKWLLMILGMIIGKFLSDIRGLTGSRNWALTFLIIGSISSNLEVKLSAFKSPAPTSDPICWMNGPKELFNCKIFPRPFSTTLGKDKRRSVCPVGAGGKNSEKIITDDNKN